MSASQRWFALALLALAQSSTVRGQGHVPVMVPTTSCRFSPITPISLPTQPMSKPSIPPPELTSTCVTTTRAARVSLYAEKGVFANVYDAWGTCDQFIPFDFSESWNSYSFSMAYYDDPQQGCTGTPTATMACAIGVSGQLTKDETFKLAGTEPHAAQYDPTPTGAAWVSCTPVTA